MTGSVLRSPRRRGYAWNLVSVFAGDHALTCQELEHVVVVPSGLLAPGAHTGLGWAIAADEVDCDLAQDGQVARGAPVAHAAVVLAEGDVEHPVQRVLDAPVRADRLTEGGRIVAAARQEVADLGLDLRGAVDAADGLDGQHGVQARPSAQGFQLGSLGAGEHPAADQATMRV